MYTRREFLMKRSISELTNMLSKLDIHILESIYAFRCLNIQQLYQLHQDSFSSPKELSHQAEVLCHLDLIKKVEYRNNEFVFFLTPLGVETIRYFLDLPSNIYDNQRKVIKRGYYRASELEIQPKNIHHQVHLNQFVINAQEIFSRHSIQWKYYDEKYVSQYSSIRPDGLISIFDIDIFLEMDMATESKKQLYEKWENYRNFLLSREYLYREKQIILLFIVKESPKSQERIDLVKYTIYERLLDKLDSEFEIYVGTPQNLLHLLEKRIIPACQGKDPYKLRLKQLLEQIHGFSVAEGEGIKNIFNNTRYDFYIRKLNHLNKITIEHNRIQEFLVDDYSFEPSSVVAKIAYMDKNNTFFKTRFNREIAYLVVGKEEQQLFRDLRMVDLIGLPNIFFSTYQRLKEKPFYEAVFQFDLLGNIHHFTNNGLHERVFETNFHDNPLA